MSIRNLILILIVFTAAYSKAGVLDSLYTNYQTSESESDLAFSSAELSTYYKRVNLDSALYFAEVSVGHARKSGDDLQMANSLNALGNVYNSKGKLGDALTIFLEAVDYAGKANDNNKIARINNNIGIVYYNQGDKDEALKYFQKTANILIKDGDTLGAIFAFNNIGGIYNDQNKQAEALAYFERGYDLAIKIDHPLAISVLLTGVATVHAATGEYDRALAEHIEALSIKRKMDNKASMLHSLAAIAEIYHRQKQFRQALRYYEELAVIADEIGQHERLKTALFNMSRSYAGNGNYLLAYESVVEGKRLEDSLRTLAENEKIAEIENKYEKSQDQKKIQLLEKNEEIRQAEISRKNLWNALLIGGGVMIIVFAGFIYSRLRKSRKQNRIIREQKKIVDLRNQEVHDSITYAKRIQQAMLQAEDREGEQLPEHFILFKPKDIVSGDFYWTIDKQEHFYLAAVDCTGHGVPGAFLTLLGTAFLNEIVSRDENISPAAILNELRERIIKELGTGAGEKTAKDGMDMSLVKVYKKDLKAEWAGANNPIWIIRNGREEIEEIKGDKEHIGFGYQMTPFTDHAIQFSKGDQFYLFSDGYADQFGVDSDGKEKKFKAKNLKSLLVQNRDLPLQEQMSSLNRSFEMWKGTLEQLDDVCVIGMRL